MTIATIALNPIYRVAESVTDGSPAGAVAHRSATHSWTETEQYRGRDIEVRHSAVYGECGPKPTSGRIRTWQSYSLAWAVSLGATPCETCFPDAVA